MIYGPHVKDTGTQIRVVKQISNAYIQNITSNGDKCHGKIKLGNRGIEVTGES